MRLPHPCPRKVRRVLLLLASLCVVATLVNVVATPGFFVTDSSVHLPETKRHTYYHYNTSVLETYDSDSTGYIASILDSLERKESSYFRTFNRLLYSQPDQPMSMHKSPVVFNKTSGELHSDILRVTRTASVEVASTTNYARRLLLGLEKWRDGQVLLNQDVAFQPARKPLHKVREFLRTKPLAEPFETDGLSPYLTSGRAVTAEAQRLHVNLFRDLLAGKKYAILFGLASFENKGDPAITVAEVVLLEKLDIKLVSYIDVRRCSANLTKESLTLAQRYPTEQVVVLMSGGGNLIGYASEEHCRRLAIKYFRSYQLVIFSESIYMRGSKPSFDAAVRTYCCNSNLTILLRDRQSLFIGRRIFNKGTRLILAPDMAFHNSPVSRYISPYYDVLWLDRHDGERPDGRALPTFPPDVRVSRGDWIAMPSLGGKTSFRKAVNVLLHGYDILQRGRVVITERLHGHILCVLLDIPHVLLDNNDLKLSSYHNTWTRGVSNCRLTKSPSQAVHLAMELLQKFNHSLPPLLSAAHILG